MENILRKDIEKYRTDEFEKWLETIFLKVHEAWNSNRPENLMHIESTLLFERDAEQMRRYTSKNLREVREKVVINYIDAKEYYSTNNKEILKVKIRASMENYVYNTITGEIISGIREYKETKIYMLTLVRRGEKEGVTNMKCLGCGANVSMMASGKCEYCGTIFYTKEYDWVIEDIAVYPDDGRAYYLY